MESKRVFFVAQLQYIHPRKIEWKTNTTMDKKKNRLEDVFPLLDTVFFSFCHVSFKGCKINLL